MNKCRQIFGRVLSAVIVLALLLGAPQAVSSQEVPTTTVGFPTYYLAAYTCDSVPIPVRVENVTDLTAYHLEIDFEPGDLIVTDIVNGGFLPAGMPEPTNAFDNDTGTIIWGMARQGPDVQPVSGSGVLIYIYVQAVNPGVTVNFTIRPYVPGDELTNGSGSILVGWPDAMPIDFTTSNGVVVTQTCPSQDIQLSNTFIDENLPLNTAVGQFTTTDLDPTETFEYTFVDSDTYGDNAFFAIGGDDGDMLLTNAVFNYEIKNSYEIKVRSTSSGGDYRDEIFTITITDVNDPPAGTDETVTIDEDETYTFTADNFGFSDSDEPPHTFSAVKITTLPTNGSLKLGETPVTAGQFIPVGNIPQLLFSTDADENGSPYASFTFQVQDNGGGTTDLDPTPNTMTINVTPVNDPPVGVADHYYVLKNMGVDSNEDDIVEYYLLSVPAPGVLGNDSDVDGDTLTATLKTGTDPTEGTLTLNADGSFTYDYTAGALNNTDSFVYTVSDGHGSTADVTVTLTIDLVDPPVSITWLEPVTEAGATYVAGDEILPITVRLSALTEVAKIEFRWWNSLTNQWVIISEQDPVDEQSDYSTTLDTSTLPNLKDIQVYAYAYDAAGNFVRTRFFIDHRMQVFLPLISR